MGANKQFVVTCYRAALREARRIDCQLAVREALAVRAPLVVDQHAPAHCWAKPDHEYRLETLRALLPGILKMPRSATFRKRELKRLIRENYDCGATATGDELDSLLDLVGAPGKLSALTALRVLTQQLRLHRCSSITTTHGCRVECTTAFAGANSDGYHYIYRCRIENLGRERVQLLSRHLIFRDEKGSTIHEVPRGTEGVVGCAPLLRPRDCFQYQSWVNLPGPVGTFRGAYQMVTRPQTAESLPQTPGTPSPQISNTSRKFDAVIKPCRLLADPS